MGIELPPELADVAAATGLNWPQADEDKLRAQANAWRSAHEKLTSLAADADATAGAATDALTGPSGDAARAMWSGFVHPDTGKLTLAARDAGAAADRLTHAADQVGAAKVEMVRQLVDAAKNTDAAHAAASAGHPTALLGLDTVLHGTAANLSSVTGHLAGSVGPGRDGGPLDLVDPNPGAHSSHGHGGLLSAVTGVPSHLLGPGPHDAGSFEDRPLLQPVHDVVGGAANAVQGAVPDAAQAVTGLGKPVDEVAQPIAGGPAPSSGNLGAPPVIPAPDPGPPSLGLPPDHGADLGTGPIQTGHYGGLLASGGFDDVPTPPTGSPAPHVPGGTVAAGFAGGGYAPPPAPPPGYGQPAPMPPQPPAAGSLPVAGPPLAPGVASVAPAVPSPPVAPLRPPPLAAPPLPGGPVAVPGAQPAPRPAASRPQPSPEPATPRTGAPAVRPRPAIEAQPAHRPPLGAPRQERESIVALFLVHMFPIGHLPVPTARPARQLPVPPSEVDYAAGLRFPPHDHPRSELIDSGDALEKVRGGFSRLPSPPQAPPPELAEGHDPVGGMPQRDWARRFLAGMRGDIPEYAWPPGEEYPEGGQEAGEPVQLPEGTRLDRFGGVHGRVFAPQGTPFAERSLPPSALHGEYRRYRVLRDVPMWTAVSAPWFGQPGGGVRYRAVYSADELVTMGYLALEEGE